MARVIISSGHSSANPGSIANGLREVDLARQIAKSTLKFLRQQGVISLAVPPEMELLQRIEWINRTGYVVATNDIAVEIHINDGGKSGIEAWFEGDGMNSSEQLAQLILNSAVYESKLPSQGAKSEFKHEIGSISFIHETNTISALIECGYIDNENDANFLKNPANIELLGKGIARGICQFLQVEFKEFAAPGAQVQTANPVNMQQAPQQIQATQAQPMAIQPNNQVQVNPATVAPVQQVQMPVQQQTSVVQQPNQQVISSFNNNAGFANSQPQTVNPVYPNPAPMGIPVAAAPAPIQVQSQAPQTVTPPPPANNFQPLPSREERKQMITQNYKEILGREPTQNDLNYFLNVGIREDELIKKMVKSQEHLDLVKSKQELQTLKEQLDNQSSELMGLRSAVEDQKRIIEGQNYSIQQKNNALHSFQQYMTQLQTQQKSSATGSTNNPNAANGMIPTAPQHAAPTYKGTFLDRLFKAFSDLFE